MSKINKCKIITPVLAGLIYTGLTDHPNCSTNDAQLDANLFHSYLKSKTVQDAEYGNSTVSYIKMILKGVSCHLSAKAPHDF